MIKHFCDLCGEVATAKVMGLTCNKGDKWRGSRMHRSSGTVTDGVFQPAIVVRAAFECENFENISDGLKPDLCDRCARELIDQLASAIFGKPETLAEQYVRETAQALAWMHGDKTLSIPLGSRLNVEGIAALKKQRDQALEIIRNQEGEAKWMQARIDVLEGKG